MTPTSVATSTHRTVAIGVPPGLLRNPRLQATPIPMPKKGLVAPALSAPVRPRRRPPAGFADLIDRATRKPREHKSERIIEVRKLGGDGWGLPALTTRPIGADYAEVNMRGYR